MNRDERRALVEQLRELQENVAELKTSRDIAHDQEARRRSYGWTPRDLSYMDAAIAEAEAEVDRLRDVLAYTDYEADGLPVGKMQR